MRLGAPLFVILLASTVLAGCDQSSQASPFEPDPEVAISRTIGRKGGLISHPLGISIAFPPGALTEETAITIAVEPLSSFPGHPEGRLLGDTYFRVLPSSMVIRKPVGVDLAIGVGALSDAERIRLGIATEDPGTPVLAEGVSFDLTSGILRGEVHRLGALAPVIADNAVLIAPRTPPPLKGGTFDGSEPSGAASAAAAASSPSGTQGGSTFRARCSFSGDIRRCIDSGDIQIWASSEIQNRLDAQMMLLNPDVTGTLELTGFVDGLPTRAKGSLSVTGTLRVQLGQAITSFSVDDTFVTQGPGGTSEVVVSGTSLTMLSTSVGSRTIEYEVRPTGTGEQLVVRGRKTVEFENDDGGVTEASLIVDMRLRR